MLKGSIAGSRRMNKQELVDASGRPIDAPPKGAFWSAVHWVWRWVGVPGLTLLVLALQTKIIIRQANIMQQQAELMDKQTKIAERQQELASRPNIVTSVEYRGPHNPSRDTLWRIENRGPYSVRDLRLTVHYFKKFVNLGWQDSSSGGGRIADVLEAGRSISVNLKGYFFPYTAKDRAGQDYVVVPGSEFYVIAFTFQRTVDDKRYLYLDPFQVLWLGAPPTELRPESTASSGPVDKSCSMDAYAIELAFEFYKRNPLPYPVELYNYHYLLGPPDLVCLQTGPKSLRW